jgi:hypothetical protein
MKNQAQTRFLATVATMLALAGFAGLTGCQGVSAPSGPQTLGTLTISPATIAVGDVVDGSSGTATATLTANDNSVTISAANTGSSAFTLNGLSLPQTIAAGNSASFTIKFSPTTNGVQSTILTFTSDAQTPETTVTLTGTGTAATHSVALSWNPSTSSNISGYNIYRAVYVTECGPFSRINPLLDGNTAYIDTSVVNGTSYCYASTAVNTSETESQYSNIVSNVQIPAN